MVMRHDDDDAYADACWLQIHMQHSALPHNSRARPTGTCANRIAMLEDERDQKAVEKDQKAAEKDQKADPADPALLSCACLMQWNRRWWNFKASYHSIAMPHTRQQRRAEQACPPHVCGCALPSESMQCLITLLIAILTRECGTQAMPGSPLTTPTSAITCVQCC